MIEIIHYKYIAVFLLAFFEGPMVAMAVGVMASLGRLALGPAYAALLFGDFVPDIGLYLIGYFAGRFNFLERFNITRNLSEQSLARLAELWCGHSSKMVAVGKLAYGFSSPILASAGLVKLPFYKYARAAIPVTLTQYAIFLGMGYYFAGSYQVFGAYFKYAEIAVASAVIIFIFIFFVVRKLTADYVKRNILNDKLVNRI